MINCFPIINGTPTVELDRNIPLRNEWLFIHWCINSSIGLSAIFLNILLLYLIKTRSVNMSTMRPLLNSSCITDLVLATVNTVAGPFLNTTHGYFTCFWNGLFPTQNRYLVEVVVSIIGWFTIGSWGCLPVQFLYRLDVVKTGARPHNKKLALYIFLGIFVFIMAMICSFNIYINPDELYRINAQKILRNSGYMINYNRIVGGHSLDQKLFIYVTYFTSVMVIAYAVIIYTEIVRHRYMHQLYAQMSSSTRRMHRDMNRTFLALATCPLLFSVLPSIFVNYTISTCKQYPILMLVLSLIIVTLPLVNSITTLMFIRPYRRVIMRWLHLLNKTSQVKDTTI